MLRLVIADDEKFTRDCIVDFTNWSQHGIEIVGLASDGLDAYQVITETKPDIAILDIQMPGMSGLEVIERLNAEGCDTVFIIVSSFDNFEYARKAIHLGVEEYLLKPFLPDEFLAAIYKSTERIRYLRGMTPPSPPEESADSTFPGGHHLALTSDVIYPVREEKVLMEALQVGSREEVLAQLDAFISQVLEANQEIKKQNSCFLILYVSLYRFSSLRSLVLSQDLSGAGGCADLSAFNRYLQDFLRRTCALLFEAMEQQRSGSYLVKRAIDYIKQHYSEELSLEIIAKNIYISPSYLSSLFRQNIGMTYIEYLNRFRVSMAKELMRSEPYLKNYEIAMRLGYSPKYFAQIFKQLEGVTLSDFRQRLPAESPSGENAKNSGRN